DVAVAGLHAVPAGGRLLDPGLYVTVGNPGVEPVRLHRRGPDGGPGQPRPDPGRNRFAADSAGAYNWRESGSGREFRAGCELALCPPRGVAGSIAEPGTTGLCRGIENQRQLRFCRARTVTIRNRACAMVHAIVGPRPRL